MIPAAIVVPPVPVAIAADPARTVISVDDPAVRIVGIVGRVVAAVEETAMMEMCEAPTMMEAAEVHSTTVPTSSAMPAATTMEGMHPSAMESTTVTAAAAMTAAHRDQTVAGG